MKNFNPFIHAIVNDVLENVLAGIAPSFDEQTSTNHYANEDLLYNKEIYLDTSSLMCDEADCFFVKRV